MTTATEPSRAPINRSIVVASVLVALVALVAYAPTANSYFHAEDFGGTHLYWNDTFAHWVTTVFDDYSQGMWGFRSPSMRPIEALTWMIDTRLWPTNAAGYHVTNLFFHMLSSVLVLGIAYRLTPAGTLVSTVAGLLFAVHPTHVEAVSWLAGRTDMIPAAFVLLTVYWFGLFRSDGRRRSLILSLFFFTLALLTKEIAVIAPFLVLAYDVAGRENKERGRLNSYRVHSGYFVLLFAYLGLRWATFGTPLSNWTNPDGAVSLQMITTFLVNQVRLLNLLVLPTNVFETRIPEEWLFMVTGTILVIAAFTLWHFRRRAAVADILLSCVYFGVVWYLVTAAPLLLAPAYPRYLYLPSAGLCIAFPLLLGRLLSRRIATSVALVVLMFMGGLLLQDTLRWRRAMTLASSIQQEAVRLGAKVPEAKIILDVPGYSEGIKLLQYSFPFALQPPFAPAGLSDRVLEKPEMYYHEWRWPQERAALISTMRTYPRDNYVIRVDEFGKVYSDRLPPGEFDDLVRRFHSGGRGANLKAGPPPE